MSAGLAIQQLVYNVLNSDISLKSKIVGIFDSVNEQQKFPYITIGDANSVPFATFGHLGEEIYMTLHVWSRYNGYKEGQQIVGDIQRLLGNKELYASGFGNVSSFFDSSDMVRDPDGITRHLMVRYRFIIQH